MMLFLIPIFLTMPETFGLEETQIVITGEENPNYGKIHYYSIDVSGKIYNNGVSSLTIYSKGDESKSGITEEIILHEGKNSYALSLFEENFGEFVSRPYAIGNTYIIEVTNLINSGTFEFTPQPKPIPEYEIPEETIEDVKTRSISVIDWIQGKLENRWDTNIRICAGEEAITNPLVQVKSDIETVQMTLSKSIGTESCARQQFQVKANDPNSIVVSLIGFKDKSQDEIKSIGNDSKIPAWVKNTFKWFVEGQISEDEVINAIQFLIKEGIIKI